MNASEFQTLDSTVNRRLQTALQQAQASCAAGQWAQVIESCEAAIALCRQLSQPPASTVTEPDANTAAALHRAKGDLFQQQGQMDAAIAAYQQALQHRPEWTALHRRLGQLTAQQQQWTVAISHYQAALASEPNHPEVRTEFGRIYIQQAQALSKTGDKSAAVQAYLQALRQDARLYEAYTRLRYNLMRYEIPKEDPILQAVVETCQEIVAQQPDLVPAQIALAYAQTKLDNLPAAIERYRHTSAQIAQRRQPDPSLWTTARRRAPDFLIIGAEKCGTTSLFQYLRQHPAVLPPLEKEIDFFDLEYEAGLDWYLAHFPPMPQQSGWVTGETSANYFYSDVAPERIFQQFPDIQLVVILRQPVDRTISRYNMMVRNGAEKRSVEQAIEEEIRLIQQAATEDDIPWKVLNRCRHTGNSLYYYHLKRWFEVFPREQFLILQSENLFHQPEETLKQLYQSLGLSHHPEQDYSKFNAGTYSPVNLAVRQQLSAFFAPHTQKLETLLNQSFNW